jgi:hypothetical protein
MTFTKLPTLRIFCARAATILCACMLSLPAHAASPGGDDSLLASRLPDAKTSLATGIARAGEQQGFPISAKLEMDALGLQLSVYTARQGRGVAAEQNELIELKGQASMASWNPELEVFADKPHIARAAMHLTVMQQSRLSLAELLKKAASQHTGLIYSIIPDVDKGKPVLKLLILKQDGKIEASSIDLTGKKL